MRHELLKRFYRMLKTRKKRPPQYTKVFFGNESVDEFYFYMMHGAKNGDLGMYWNGIKFSIPIFICIMALVYSIFYNVLVNKSIYVSIKGKKHK